MTDRSTAAWQAKYALGLEKGYTGERYTPSFKPFTASEAAAAADRSIGSQQLGSQFWMNSDYGGAEPSQATKEAFSGAEYDYAWKESVKKNISTGMERNDAAYRAYMDAMPPKQTAAVFAPTPSNQGVWTGPSIEEVERREKYLGVGFDITPTTAAGIIIASEPTPIPLFVVVGTLLLAAFLLLGR